MLSSQLNRTEGYQPEAEKNRDRVEAWFEMAKSKCKARTGKAALLFYRFHFSICR